MCPDDAPDPLDIAMRSLERTLADRAATSTLRELKEAIARCRNHPHFPRDRVIAEIGNIRARTSFAVQDIGALAQRIIVETLS